MSFILSPSGVVAETPILATDVPKAEIEAVFEILNGSIDKQVRVVDRCGYRY